MRTAVAAKRRDITAAVPMVTHRFAAGQSFDICLHRATTASLTTPLPLVTGGVHGPEPSPKQFLTHDKSESRKKSQT